MSGGHFNYSQSRIAEIIEETERQYAYRSKKRFSQYGDGEPYSPEVLKEIRKGIAILKKAYIYAERIDYLFSGDDGEESFLERLKEDLNSKK